MTTLSKRAIAGIAVGLMAGATAGAVAADYAIVVSQKTQADAPWRLVVDVLQAKHRGSVVVYAGGVRESLADLQKLMPRYTCFVATPAEASRLFVVDVHRLTRQLDDDPYTDTIWGILTGYDAANAMEIARHSEPLVVRKVAAGTDVAIEMCEEGVWYCELTQNRMVQKNKGEAAKQVKGPADTTKAMVDTLNEYKADLFVTSGHATERDWQIGYRYRNGSFQSKAGKMAGVDTQGKRWPIESPNPKVYLPIGNCLMGHIDGPDAMALAWMNSAGVKQMIGYTVPSWYGYAGWGCLDYFVEQPGRYTFAEAFFANDHALIYRLGKCFPELLKQEPKAGEMFTGTIALSDAAKVEKLRANDGVGLLFDRDVVAFYGDPAWEARMAKGELRWEQSLTEKDGVYTLEIRPRKADKTFEPVNINGSQRGHRPIVQFLPGRVKNAKLLEGQDLQPVITDDLVLLPQPGKYESDGVYRVRFTAERVR